MKENLTVTVKAPLWYDSPKDIDGKYLIPEDYNYEPVLDHIKRFSLLYYGVECDPKIEDLKYVAGKGYGDSHFTYDWIGAPNYSYSDRLWNMVEAFGWNTGIYSPQPIRPSAYMDSPKEGWKPSGWAGRMQENIYALGDYDNLVKLYDEIRRPPNRLAIWKSMFRSIRIHLQFLINPNVGRSLWVSTKNHLNLIIKH